MTLPYLRPAPPEGTASLPCRTGWVAAPAGNWRGAPVEVVFDPARHRVVFLRGPSKTVTRALTRAGYSCRDREGQDEMWVAGVTPQRATPVPGRPRFVGGRG